ncbi:MAG: T9SS type A sorting domain-containing protein, partial [Chitinophagales bacterium]
RYGELYVAFNSRSIDIGPQLGGAIHKLYGSYHGGIDAVVARLIDSSAFHFHCTPFREGTKADDLSGVTVAGESILVYPNPSNNLFNIQVVADEVSFADYSIFDNVGRLVAKQEVGLSPGINNIEVDLYNNPNGIYFLQLQFQNKVHRVKLLKQ